jgi:hypothetical protein
MALSAGSAARRNAMSRTHAVTLVPAAVFAIAVCHTMTKVADVMTSARTGSSVSSPTVALALRTGIAPDQPVAQVAESTGTCPAANVERVHIQAYDKESLKTPVADGPPLDGRPHPVEVTRRSAPTD